MNRSRKFMMIGLMGIISLGIIVGLANANAEELTTVVADEDSVTCDGTGDAKQNRHGENGAHDGTGDGNGNMYQHQYEQNLDENGDCVNA